MCSSDLGSSHGSQWGGSGTMDRGQSSHRGRGPKGYKRSDERIREDVSDRLGEHEYLDCSEIEVNVTNGEVTLTGSVRHRHEKFLAEEVADDVSGVSEVHNQLRVKREQSAPSTTLGTSENATGSAAQSGTEAGRTRNARA